MFGGAAVAGYTLAFRVILFEAAALFEYCRLPELFSGHQRDAVIDLKFHRSAGGATGYCGTNPRGKLHVIRQPIPWSLTADFGERALDAIGSLLLGH